MDKDAVLLSFQEQLKAYRKLENIKESKEFQDFFDYLVDNTAAKLLWMIQGTKDGDNVKNYDEFCRARGEIVASLEIVRTIGSSTAMKQQVKQQLEEFINPA